MKIKALLTGTHDFLRRYLQALGVEDIEGVINPSMDNVQSPWGYPSMEVAVDRLKMAIDKDERIGILCDPDGDGCFSSSLIYNFIKFVHSETRITPFFHVGKAHGLVQNQDEDIVQQVIDADIDLLIVPDAGSNNIAQCKQLRDVDIDTIITDHHVIKQSNPYAIVINPHTDPRLNHALSGAGVTYHFVRACAETWGIDIGDLYLDLVAASLVTDVCDMRVPENQAFVHYGLTHITNKTLQVMFDKFNWRGNTPEGIAWGIGPMINATTRADDNEAMKAIFYALVGEGDVDEAIKLARKAHKAQIETVKEVVNTVSDSIDHDHKVLVGFTENEHKSYTGLIAGKFTGQYHKPTFILRPINTTTWSGSLRSPVDIASQINETGLALCQGHESAAGIIVKKSNLKRLIKWFDNLELDMEPPVEIATQIQPKDITMALCKACSDNVLLWSGSDGGKVPPPKFYMVMDVKPDEVAVFRKKTTTVKINKGVSILKFMAKQEDVDMLTSGPCRVKVIVALSVNEYNGEFNPQAKIEAWEIESTGRDIEADWENVF